MCKVNRGRRLTLLWLPLMAVGVGCGNSGFGGDGGADGAPPSSDGAPPPIADRGTSPPRTDGALKPLAPSCGAAAGGGAGPVAAPKLAHELKDAWHEGWLGSVAVVDLDGSGRRELVAVRDNRLVVWKADGSVAWRADLKSGRIWASPVVADLVAGGGLEVAVASRKQVHAFDAAGAPLAGFPVAFRDELRAIAAGDIDGDGALEIVVVTTDVLSKDGQQDLIMAYEADGSPVSGFPPNTSGTSGCDDDCYVTGGYDQCVALGDVDGDGKLDIFAAQDNAYLSLHAGDGRAFDASPMFEGAKKWPGVRFLHDYDLAKQGWADNEAQANQAHFTNSAPAIADIDGDGTMELVILGSVQNASQSDRKRGVALWLLHHDASRAAGWEAPYQVEEYLAGLWDFEGTNVVGATNQVSVADIDPDAAGLEMVFAGFDGQLHCVSAGRESLWSYRYTSNAKVLTAGVALADLNGDGAPEVVFASYSPDNNNSHLFVLDAAGQQLHKLALPGRGAMAVPTVADLDGDGVLEIWLSLKDGDEGQALVHGYAVAGSSDNCLLWPTGRGNLLRNGYLPK